MNAVLGAIALGWLLGMGTHWLSMWRWRRMYHGGAAECWRCHGSGRESR